MPRFFFDIDDGVSSDGRDEAGVELTDAQAARREAIATLVGIAMEVLPNGDHHTFSARVRDANGRQIYTTTLTLDGSWVA